MNIVSMAMQYLTPTLIDRLAASLGISSPLARAAIAALLPSILAGLTGVAARPEGSRHLSDVLGNQPGDILGNLEDIFGGARQTEVTKNGGETLRDLLGGSSVSGLTQAVGTFTGLGGAEIQSLSGLLSPVVLGTLGGQQKEQGLDAAGLAGFLASQKDNVRAALPERFGDLLKGTGLLDGLTSASEPTGEPMPAQKPGPVAPAARGMGLLPMLLAAAAIAVGGYAYLDRVAPGAGLPAAPQIVAGPEKAEIGAQLRSVAEGLRGTLVTMRDEASARGALPRLQEISAQLDSLHDSSRGLPPATKRPFASYAAQLMPVLRPLIERASTAGGVGPIVKPILDQILTRLEALTKA